MTFLQGVKKLFTTPISFLGFEEQQFDQRSRVISQENEKKVYWFDSIFSWPVFLLNWFLEIILSIFIADFITTIKLKDKPNKFKIAFRPLLKKFYIVVNLLVVIFFYVTIFISVIALTNWIITNF
ncbi:hypothetical protein IPN41_02770 [Candidatus Falkowbacteria bacterium]|nr:MAG: hypothetical protein IPN41_02770 [Candidatus Falkowbacteria bacterium]